MMFPPIEVTNGMIKSILPTNEFKFEVPRGSIHHELVKKFNENIERAGDWIWLMDYITKNKVMASEYEAGAKKFSKILAHYGVEKGDRIHVCLGNHHLTYVIYGAVWILGGVVSCGNVALGADGIRSQLTDINAKLMICIPDVAEKMKMATETQILTLGQVDGCVDILEKFSNIAEDGSPDPIWFSEEDVKKEDCVIFWSSGTTGVPKGIRHTHYSAWNISGWIVTQIKPDSSIVSTLAYHHMGGFFAATNSCIRRNTYYYRIFDKRFNLDLAIQTIVETQCSTLILLYHHYVQLSDAKEILDAKADDLGSVELVMPAGAAVPASCEERLKSKMKNLKFVTNCYGSTETGLVTIGQTTTNLGHVLPGNTIKIVNPDTKTVCGQDEIGEICVKNAVSMKGYLNRPVENNEFFDDEQFAHIGDLGYWDAAGTLHFLERMKDVIRYDNKPIAPTELEDILQTHPAVKESLVFGITDFKVMELVSVVICLNPGYEITDDEVKEFVNSKVDDFKQIRGPVIFRDFIPRNAMGKLMRREMRKWAMNQVTAAGDQEKMSFA